MKRILAGAMCAALALPTLTACADKASDDTKAVKVSASDDKCELDNTKGQTGMNSFSVTNSGKKVTEFYVIDDHGRVQGEVENIGPGASRTLSVELRTPGKYTTQCKPGMIGDGIKGEFTVSGDKIDDTKGDPKLAASKDAYRKYVRSQAKVLDDQTKSFVTSINDGNVKEAKAIYPRARTPYERIEPVAESFPNDLDPRIDAREADIAQGDEWTGFHRIEKDLWSDTINDDTKKAAAQLQKDVDELQASINDDAFEVSPVQIASGAQGLLDEIATSKITGEEDIYSGTDLYDFQANLEGSRAAIDSLKDPLEARQPGLIGQIGQRFDKVQQLLDKYRQGSQSFVDYKTIDDAKRQELSDALDDLTEQVSKAQGAVA